ncbi:major facilitator superfamily transporter [Histoplasma capsulatum G186AR]|uniref:Major facilitator superfamily transporter n=1 Tax=Ajellomyces capsulatus (strain G186AR / H82 / ATCC MYA-2454 / RMSCC 2432) TaxID=447093 RepID=C0P129_AJECG|nr:major facilitator superfamily transporter [Histoplasma capsulatum G186AR]EEH02665.1 major facilitator superfamily transporter [Histoplasma capsulatum G186AR]
MTSGSKPPEFHIYPPEPDSGHDAHSAQQAVAEQKRPHETTGTLPSRSHSSRSISFQLDLNQNSIPRHTSSARRSSNRRRSGASSLLLRNLSQRWYKKLPSPPSSPPLSSFIDFAEHDPDSVLSLPRRWPSLYAPPGRQDQIEPRPDAEAEQRQGYGSGYLRGWPLVTVSVAALLACFVTQLDESIIATALPNIAAEFHSLGDIGWYNSTYYLPQAVLQPLFGQVYTRWRIKRVYLISLFLFEVISSVLGPLLGGIVTQYLSWRWCFGINVPIGSVIVVIMAVLLKIPRGSNSTTKSTWKKRLMELDILGTILLTAMIVCVLLGFHMVQKQRPNKAGVGAVFVAAIVAAIALFIQQRLTLTETLLPIRIFGRRLVWATCGLMFSLSVGIATHISFLPLYLQLVRGKSPASSGTHTVPYVLSIFTGSIIMMLSLIVMKYLNILFLSGVVCYAIGAGLFTTFDVNSTLGEIVGFQVLAGLGFGLCVLCLVECPQAILADRDVPYAQGVINMFQILGGATSTQVATLIFIQTLSHRLERVPNLPQDQIRILLADPTTMLYGNSSDSKGSHHINDSQTLPSGPLRSRILNELSGSFSATFHLSIVAACLALTFVLCMPWTRKRTLAATLAVEAGKEANGNVKHDGNYDNDNHNNNNNDDDGDINDNNDNDNDNENDIKGTRRIRTRKAGHGSGFRREREEEPLTTIELT